MLSMPIAQNWISHLGHPGNRPGHRLPSCDVRGQGRLQNHRIRLAAVQCGQDHPCCESGHDRTYMPAIDRGST